MCSTDEKLKICLKIDEETIYDFNETINESSIIASAKAIEQLLIKNNAEPSKIQDMYEVLIEVMQNILNYSKPSGTGMNKTWMAGVFHWIEQLIFSVVFCVEEM